MAVEYRKSALQSLMEEIPSLVYAASKDKANKMYQTQLILLRSAIDEKKELRKEYRFNLQRMTDLGITKDMLESVSSVDATSSLNTDKLLNIPAKELSGAISSLEQRNVKIGNLINTQLINLTSFEAGQNIRIDYQDTALPDDVYAKLDSNPWFRAGYNSKAGDFYKKTQAALIDPTSRASDKTREKELEFAGEKATVTYKAQARAKRESYLESALATGYSTVRNISTLTDEGQILAYKETSGIQDRWSRMSSEELDAIAEEAAYAKGLGYDDVLPNQFDYSDETALMAGIRMRAEEDLEDKLGANGYDDAAVDRWVEAAVSGLKGGQMLDVSGNIKNLDPNEAYSKFLQPESVSIYKGSVEEAIYKSPTAKRVFADKEALASQLKSFVISSKTGEVLDDFKWKKVKGRAKKLGFTKESYSKAVSLLSNVSDTNVLQYLYINKDSGVRDLLELVTGTTARNVMMGIAQAEKEIEDTLKSVETKRTIKRDDKDAFKDILDKMYK